MSPFGRLWAWSVEVDSGGSWILCDHVYTASWDPKIVDSVSQLCWKVKESERPGWDWGLAGAFFVVHAPKTFAHAAVAGATVTASAVGADHPDHVSY